MRRLTIPTILALACIVGCAKHATKTVTTVGTLAELHNVSPDVKEVKVEQGLDQLHVQLPAFLEEAPETAMTRRRAASRRPATREEFGTAR
jgi:hypothetical protein